MPNYSEMPRKPLVPRALTPGHREPAIPVLLTLTPPPWHVELQKASLDFSVNNSGGKSNWTEPRMSSMLDKTLARVTFETSQSGLMM